MENQNIQSDQSNHEYEEVESVNTVTSDKKIQITRRNFELTFDEKDQLYLTRKCNFLRNYKIVDLLEQIKTSEEWENVCALDRESVNNLFDIYASQIIEMDNKFKDLLMSQGEWIPEALNSFMDSGYNMYNRYFKYKLLGYENEIADHGYIKFSFIKVIALRGFFVGMIVLNVFLFLRASQFQNQTILGINKMRLVQTVFGMFVIIDCILLKYASEFDYWVRSIMQNKYDKEIAEQISYNTATINDLNSDILNLREQIAFNLKDLIINAKQFKIRTINDTYLTLSQIKRILINRKLLPKIKQDMLLMILGVQQIYHFLDDFGFVYLVLKSHINKFYSFFLALLISFGFSYYALPFVSRLPGFWQNFTAAIAAEGIINVTEDASAKSTAKQMK